ncbi:MAG: hypothetical protein AAFX55_02300 [Bacteroidota bacterium]
MITNVSLLNHILWDKLLLWLVYAYNVILAAAPSKHREYVVLINALDHRIHSIA